MAATVWFIDDEESVRKAVGDMLKSLGYTVKLFGDGAEAIKEYGKRPADVVITDIRMPGMSGMDVTRKLLDLDPFAIVMIYTAYPSIPDAVNIIREGATDYLSKPTRIDEIQVRIERALEGREALKRIRKMRWALGILIATLPVLIIVVLVVLLLRSGGG